MNGTRQAIAFLSVLALGAAWINARAESSTSKVMGSIEIAAGEHSGDASTVNGSIRVGAGAAVQDAHTVNGSITLEARASAGGLKTVNGSVELGEGARVQGDVRSVNGRLTLAKGADVRGNLTNVNGEIRVDSAHVGGGITTVSGGIELSGAHIDGGVHIEKNHGSDVDSTPPRVVVGPGSVVRGTLEFERPVKLYVSDRASIGPVQGASPIKYSGDSPSRD